MRIYYSPDSDPMILDTVSGMNELHDRVSAFIGAYDSSLTVLAEASASPEPYQRFLQGLTIQKSSAPISVVLTPDGNLKVTGSPDNLKIYFGFLKFKEDENGRHHHPEYVLIDGEPKKGYFTPGSLSVIMEADNERIQEIGRANQAL